MTEMLANDDPEEAIAGANPQAPREISVDNPPKQDALWKALRPVVKKARDWIKS